jgi:hypothetical protein
VKDSIIAKSYSRKGMSNMLKQFSLLAHAMGVCPFFMFPYIMIAKYNYYHAVSSEQSKASRIV